MHYCHVTQSPQKGFTLIELSIVLVIIGLIIGGILVGRDLISASEVRAQIAQIEKYNAAVNTFKNKYGGIPGDLNIPLVTQFGFTQGTNCTGAVGSRDGNGLIDGYGFNYTQAIGETGLFWQDLSSVGLIDGTFPNGGAPAIACTNLASGLISTPGSTYVGDYFPAAKIGHGNFVYVYETGGYNWYGLLDIMGTGGGFNAALINTLSTIPVIQAYNIDKKIDDGIPTTGSVVTVLVANGVSIGTPPNAATDSTTTCYSGTTPNFAYSLSASANGGAGLNCALSFKFQ